MPDPAQKKRPRRRVPTRREIGAEARRVAREVLARHRNNHDEAMADLADQTHELRERNRRLKAKLPKEGDIVLTGDQAKRWTAVEKALKDLTPEEIEKLPTEVKDLRTKLGTREEEDLLSEVATAAKFPKGILADLKRARNLTVTTKTEKVKSTDKDGKEVIEDRKVVYITKPGQGETPIELSKYIEAEAPEYKDKFETTDGTQGDKGGTGTRRRTFQTTQTATGSDDDSKKKSGVDALIEANAAAARAPNPLRPAKSTT